MCQSSSSLNRVAEDGWAPRRHELEPCTGATYRPLRKSATAIGGAVFSPGTSCRHDGREEGDPTAARKTSRAVGFSDLKSCALRFRQISIFFHSQVKWSIYDASCKERHNFDVLLSLYIDILCLKGRFFLIVLKLQKSLPSTAKIADVLRITWTKNDSPINLLLILWCTRLYPLPYFWYKKCGRGELICHQGWVDMNIVSSNSVINNYIWMNMITYFVLFHSTYKNKHTHNFAHTLQTWHRAGQARYSITICWSLTLRSGAEQFAPRNFKIARSYLPFSLLYKEAKGAAAVCHCRCSLFHFLDRYS